MDELLALFMESNYTEELCDEINRTFGLIEFFQYKDAYSGLIDIVTQEGDTDKNAMHDMFIQEIHAKLNYMLKQHTITLINTATIMQKNEILLALAHIQNLEDYTSIILTLESFDPDEEQLASILEGLTMMDQHTIMTLVEEFDKSLLKKLKDYIYLDESRQPHLAKIHYSLLEHYKLFNKVYGVENVGSQLVMAGMSPGEHFTTYMGYLDDPVIGKTDEATAINMLSLIYLSADGYNSPLLIYRKFSLDVLQDLNLVSKIEVHILNMIAVLAEHKKANYDQVQLSSSGV